MKKVSSNNTVHERSIIYHHKMREWGVFPEGEFGSRIEYLAKLLGFEDREDMLDNYNEEVERTVRLLAGPNSYAVYKMILLKREDGLT